MLRSMKDLEDYAIRATDGNIGHVKDFYFDDEAWVIRYLIVDTGNWLSSGEVLISPIAIGHPDWAKKVLPVSITKEQVKNAPTSTPTSRYRASTRCATSGTTAIPPIGAVPGCAAAARIRA